MLLRISNILVSPFGLKNITPILWSVCIASVLLMQFQVSPVFALSLLITALLLASAFIHIVSSEIKAIGMLSQQSQVQNFDHRELKINSGIFKDSLSGVNEMLRDLERYHQARTESLNEITHLSEELSQSASTVSTNVSTQTDAISSAAAAVSEMTHSIEQVAEKARDVHLRAGDARQLTENGKDSLTQAREDVSTMSNTADETALLMEQLTEQSNVVADMSKVIREISDQTNLLALNAAIEAARAGEHGRGFAVVADEVRQLARRSHESADEITTRIHHVMGDMKNVHQQMKALAGMAHSSLESTNHAQQIFIDVDEQVDSVAQQIIAIATNTEQQAQATNEISTHIEGVLECAEENQGISNETARMAKYMVGLTSNPISTWGYK